MRAAVDAFLEAGRMDAAHAVELAMHSRELAIEGRRDAEATQIRETAPGRAKLAELLRAASGLHAEWGNLERSQALAELSKVYADQWRHRMMREDGEREGLARDDLDSLERRVDILRSGRVAFAEWGQAERSLSCTQLAEYYARRGREQQAVERERAERHDPIR